MTRMVYKQCFCGKYHDINISRCDCGEDISSVVPAVVEGELSADKIGFVDPALTVYEQKCPACSKVYYLTDSGPEHKIRRCTNCSKVRIASRQPVPFLREVSEEPAEDPASHCIAQAVSDQVQNGQYQTLTETPASVSALQSMRQEMEAAAAHMTEKAEDSGDVSMGGWGALEQTGASETNKETKSRLTLTEKVSNICMEALEGDDPRLPFLLGRAAGLGRFLRQDLGVSSRHCYFEYRGRQWYVTDNGSTNGTKVNGKTIEPYTAVLLHSGDLVTLGCLDDSTTFQIVIEAI